jgi:DNA replication protein DnaC
MTTSPKPNTSEQTTVTSQPTSAQTENTDPASIGDVVEGIGVRERIASHTVPHGVTRFEGQVVCAKHLTPLDSEGDVAYCGACGREAVDRQAALDHEDRDRENQALEAKGRQAELEKRLGASGIPARYRDCTFGSFPGKAPAAVRACGILRGYANTWRTNQAQGISALLIGGAGTGKTGLACAVGNAVIREWHGTAAFMTAYGAVRHLRDTWGRKGRTEREALDDLINVDLLILDEVGAGVGTDAELSALFEVINGRYASRRSMLLISNLPIADYQVDGAKRPGLSTFLGPRVIDRFNDDGSFTLAFNWESLRGARE